MGNESNQLGLVLTEYQNRNKKNARNCPQSAKRFIDLKLRCLQFCVCVGIHIIDLFMFLRYYVDSTLVINNSLRATTLVFLKISVYFTKRTNFFIYFTYSFLQNTHINLFIIHIILFK